jgi:hypothetical protein
VEWGFFLYAVEVALRDSIRTTQFPLEIYILPLLYSQPIPGSGIASVLSVLM